MSTKINTIIVEDELMAQKALQNLCSNFKSINLLNTFENVEDALLFLESASIDLVFLDIELPGMSGIDMINKMPYLPQIVFTTGNREYAYEAFEYEITDFLKKPITIDRFTKAVSKVEEIRSKRNAISSASEKRELYIKSDGKLIRLEYNSILYFENVGDYIKAITLHGNYIFHGTMKSIDQKITDPRFLKVHRSYIVNLNKIVDIQDNSLLIEKKVIPVSRAYKAVLIESINTI